MNKVVKIVGGIVVIGAIVGSGYWFSTRHNKTPVKSDTTVTTTQTTTTQTKSNTPTTKLKTLVTVKDFDPAGLFNASETRKLTDFTPWLDSSVSPTYVDYNDDGVMDVFVWAKLPGTKGFSFAAVWTIGSDNAPKELWYVPNAEQFVQSAWTTSGITFTEKGSIESPAGLDPQTNIYHWQSGTFVTY